MTLWRGRMQFSPPRRKIFRRNAKKTSLTVPKWKIKKYFFLRKFFEKKCLCGHVESSYRNLADSLSKERQNLQLNVWKNIIPFFPKNISFLNMFFWTHWMQLSQPRQKVFDRGPKLIRSISKTANTSLFLSQTKCFSQKIWHRTSECSFNNPAKIFPTNGQNAFAQGPKKIKRTEEFPLKYFLLKFFEWTRKMQFSKPRP